MRILHLTDSHGTMQTPESRTDLYYYTFLRKMAELKFVIKQLNIDMVLHTGDLFHYSKVSNKFMGQVAEIFKSYGVDVYVVPGNHDIDGYTVDTIDQTSLGLLAKTKIVKLLTRDTPLRLDVKDGQHSFSVAISGQEYYKDIDTGKMEDFEMQQDEADINILAIHGYITDTPQHPDIRATLVKDVITNADIVLSGHYHRKFAVEAGDVSFYNPGSALRVDMTDYNKNHMPQYGVLEVGCDKTGDIFYDYQFHQFKVAQPGTSIFDFSTKYQTKAASVTLENFKTSIANTMQNIAPTISFTSIIDQICNTTATPQFDVTSLKTNVMKMYNTALAATKNELNVNIGYIPSQDYIYISSLEIHNFQSHKDTVINFHSGTNIIVGESNSGKTSIFRAILWATDNDPLGTDFIMTGETECWVKINYSNGGYIQRYRTLKDAGTYEVKFFDDVKKQWFTQTYQGFAASVPIDVANVHQMPKISITKNIETHLNMMTQLERPFLLTESQAEKAAAIGRITGTNIVDDAIKMTNTENLGLNRDIKEINADIASTEMELNKLPAVGLSLSYLTLLNNLNLSADYMNHVLFSGAKVLEELESNEILIHETNLKIDEYKDALTVKLDIAEADKMIALIQKLISIKKRYTEASDNADVCNKRIAECKEVLKLKEKIADAEAELKKASLVMGYAKKHKPIVTTITNLSDDINRKSQFILMSKSIVSHAAALNGTFHAGVTTLDQYDQIKHSIMNHTQQIESCISEKEISEVLLNTTQEEMSSYILSQEKCPCCGQKITEKQVHSIMNNISA